jgi:hypothetical protein
VLKVDLRNLDFFVVGAGQRLQDAGAAVDASEACQDRVTRDRIGRALSAAASTDANTDGSLLLDVTKD